MPTRGSVRIGEFIAKGSSGAVYAADVEGLGGRDVAIKVGSDALREARLYARAGRHPNVVSVYGTATHEGEGHTMLLMERALYSASCVLSPLPSPPAPGPAQESPPSSQASTDTSQDASPPAPCTAATVLRLLRDGARGLAFLHSKRIVHRDVAARNILVMKDGRAAIADLGLAVVLPEDKDYLIDREMKTGPLRYMAPECLWWRSFSPASDTYAFGMVIYEVLSHCRPYDRASACSIPRLITDGCLPLFAATEDWQAALVALQRRCQAHYADQRPSMAEVADELDELCANYKS